MKTATRRAMPLAALVVTSVSLSPRAQEPAIFTFGVVFWLHLHHFLYVLGRAEAGLRSGGWCRLTWPYAEGNGMWELGSFASFKTALDAEWRPHLRGAASLTTALDGLMGAVR